MEESVLYVVGGKRLLDAVASGLGLLVLSPLLVWVAWRVWRHDGRPVFFAHARTARGGRTFSLLKFRSMVRNAASIGPSYTDAGDPRITPMGAWLRRTSLDELPQLINVLRGDMSLVGPRPDTPGQTAALPPEAAARRWSVRPGITGWAQVNGRSAIAPDMRLVLDLEYVDRVSLRLDLQILLRTICMAVRRTDAAW
jgi:lipopolysaccharide/colanic/teichoic acid biosynthesis glycosyltransferase